MSSPRRILFGAGLAGALLLAAQCGSTGTESAPAAAGATSLQSWGVIYGVLQHPRCMNCHPLGDAPLQGDASVPTPRTSSAGPTARASSPCAAPRATRPRMRPAPHLPPGAPNWHLPRADMPLVFEGRSSSELCRQLRDPAQNGGKSPEQLFDHMAHDALVLWGWDPGEGRTPVPVPQKRFAAAVRAWVDGGCDCPE